MPLADSNGLLRTRFWVQRITGINATNMSTYWTVETIRVGLVVGEVIHIRQLRVIVIRSFQQWSATGPASNHLRGKFKASDGVAAAIRVFSGSVKKLPEAAHILRRYREEGRPADPMRA